MAKATTIPKMMDDPAYRAEWTKLQELYDRKRDVELRISKFDEAQAARPKHVDRFTAAALTLLDGGVESDKPNNEERRKLFDELHTVEAAISIQQRRETEAKFKARKKICEMVKPQVQALVRDFYDAMKLAIHQKHATYDQFIGELIADDAYAAHILRPLRFTAKHIQDHRDLAQRFNEWESEAREYGMLT